MTHANLDPVRLAYHGWKKRLVGPIERWLFSKTDRVVVTCEAEKAWCERWGLKNAFEVVDLKRSFELGGEGEEVHGAHSPEAEGIPLLHLGRPLRVLYLGRRHPLKGVEYLRRAVEELNGEAESFPLQKKEVPPLLRSDSPLLQLRIVSDHFGEELERDWAWCDVLCLPTLSENFGLVVAEALERGKRVITTDGAPAWEPAGGLFDCSDCSIEGLLDWTRVWRTVAVSAGISGRDGRGTREAAEGCAGEIEFGGLSGSWGAAGANKNSKVAPLGRRASCPSREVGEAIGSHPSRNGRDARCPSVHVPGPQRARRPLPQC